MDAKLFTAEKFNEKPEKQEGKGGAGRLPVLGRLSVNFTACKKALKHPADGFLEDLDAAAILFDVNRIGALKTGKVTGATDAVQDDRDLGDAIDNFVGQLDGIHVGKVRIQDQQVDAVVAVDDFQQIPGVVYRTDPVAVGCEFASEKLPDAGISIGDKNFACGSHGHSFDS